MNLARTLNSLGKAILVKYKHINYGGCAVYAAIVGEELEKRGIDVRGMVGSVWARSDVNLEEVRGLIKKSVPSEWANNDVYFGHVALEIKHSGRTWHYDANGAKRPGKHIMKLPLYPGRMSIQDLKYLAGTADGWNTLFSRRHIPEIRRLTKQYFEKLDLTPNKYARSTQSAA